MEVLDLTPLKSEYDSHYRNYDKNILDFYEMKFQNTYTMGIILNYIIDTKEYEVYCYIYTDKQTASHLKIKYFKNKLLSKIYFNYLKLFMSIRDLKFFFNN